MNYPKSFKQSTYQTMPNTATISKYSHLTYKKESYRPIFSSEISYCYEEGLPDWKPMNINSEKEPDFMRLGEDHRSLYV